MKRSWQRRKNRKMLPFQRFLSVMIFPMIAAAALVYSPAPALAAQARRGQAVMYVYDASSLGLRSSDAARLDQINYAFALIANGEASGSHWRGIRELKNYLKQHPNVDGVLSVGGWGADGFSQACATQEGREKLADSILRLMDEHGFVGVDIDWEYPGVSFAGIASSKNDEENWYALLSLLRAGLDKKELGTGRHYTLSVALSVSQASTVNAARLNRVLDQVVLMAYDLYGFTAQTGHQAGLYPAGGVSESGAYGVKALVRGGMARSKILLGIPAYGRIWRQAAGGNGYGVQAGTTGDKLLNYADVRALESSGYTHYYDDTAQAAWWYDGANFVSAEDEQSLRYKARWVLEQGLLGTAVWAYAHDNDGSVTRILSEELR